MAVASVMTDIPELIWDGPCRVYRLDGGLHDRTQLREALAQLPDDVIVVHQDGRDEMELLEEVSAAMGDDIPSAILFARLGGELLANAPR